MKRYASHALALVCLVTAASCDNRSNPVEPSDRNPGSGDALAGFRLEGDPASTSGATWTYRSTVDGVVYDLQGILFKPAGVGPFPAVVLSHGAGGNANGYSRAVARVMVGWGLVCIATNYTHAGGVVIGSPGGASEPGASLANVQRAGALLEMLRALDYVDMRRVAAHGHSMGAFVTTALAGADPDSLLTVSHTAGGVRPDWVPGVAPTEGQAQNIRAPYQMHHGDADPVVALSADQRLSALLSARGVPNELIIYSGAGHNDISTNGVVLESVRSWYRTRGVF